MDPATQHAAGGCGACCCRGRCEYIPMQAALALAMRQCQTFQHTGLSATAGRSAWPVLQGVLSIVTPDQGCTSSMLGSMQA